MNTNIYIVKGGDSGMSVWHGADTLCHLTTEGEKSCESLQTRIANWQINVAFSSTEKRIIDSAKIVLKNSGITATISEDLRPRKITPFEGMSGDEVKVLYRKYNDIAPQHKVTSDGVFSKIWGPWELGAFEINESLRERIKNFTDMVLDNHQGQNVFVQTHVDWIREAYRLFTNAPDSEDYAVSTKSVVILQFNENKELISIEREGMPKSLKIF